MFWSVCNLEQSINKRYQAFAKLVFSTSESNNDVASVSLVLSKVEWTYEESIFETHTNERNHEF